MIIPQKGVSCSVALFLGPDMQTAPLLKELKQTADNSSLLLRVSSPFPSWLSSLSDSEGRVHIPTWEAAQEEATSQ